jgi:hypothetical protein
VKDQIEYQIESRPVGEGGHQIEFLHHYHRIEEILWRPRRLEEEALTVARSCPWRSKVSAMAELGVG